MPLTIAPRGEKLVIERISGKDDTKRFLENLGFTQGKDVLVISEASGNMIVNVRDTRIAISKSMANRIMVS